VTVADGRAIKVEGDPHHPTTRGVLCTKVARYLERTYSDQRVLHPLRRIGAKEWRRAMNPATAATMKQFMLQVVQRGTGTAAQIPGIQVAGKTGTAETNPGQNPHAWFIAVAPADHPKYAIAVLVEHGGFDGVNAEITGGRVAAPIAASVLRVLLGA